MYIKIVSKDENDIESVSGYDAAQYHLGPYQNVKGERFLEIYEHRESQPFTVILNPRRANIYVMNEQGSTIDILM